MTQRQARVEGEHVPSATPNIDILRGIVERGRQGSTDGAIEVRGGYYDKNRAVWVSAELDYLLNTQLSEELPYLEVMAGVSLVTGELYRAQIKDGEDRVLWPQEFFDEGGSDLLRQAAQRDATFENPYCVHPDGDDATGIPYSVRYASYYQRIVQYLKQALDLESPSVKAQRGHIDALLAYYTVDNHRDGERERELVERTERTWVAIPDGTPVMPLIGSHEPYQDPLRQLVGADPQIQAWVGEVRQRRHLPPWKVFAESRVTLRLDNADAPVSRAKIKAIQKASDRLYEKQAAGTRVSTEFRVTPWAAGIMAYQSTAKNLPNHEGIRAEVGYRNVVNVNIRDAGIETQQITAARRLFGPHTWIGQQDLFQRLRRSANIVGHEENHPRWVMDETSMEELKCDVLGVNAILMANNVMNEQVFADEDYENAILFAVISAIALNERYKKAMDDGDTEAVDQLRPYYRAQETRFKTHLNLYPDCHRY